MKIKDKLFYGLTMLPLLPMNVFAESASSGGGASPDPTTYYGGLIVKDGTLRVGTGMGLADIINVEENATPLTEIVDTSNGLLTFGKMIVALGIVIAIISVIYAGIQYANSLKSAKKEEAKMRLMYSLIGVALLGGIGLLVNFSFNIF